MVSGYLHIALGNVLSTAFIFMWQSRVEIEHYSIVYFNHTTAFEAL